MGHLETVFGEREQAVRVQETLREQSEARCRQEMADLAQANEQLLFEVARLEQREKAVGESAQQFSLLFQENPLPMWIVDLRSSQFLAVNNAALGQLGYPQDEFLGLNATQIVSEDLLESFKADLARPCPAAQCRGVWQHVRHDGAIADLELRTVDLKTGDVPTRLVVAQDVTERETRQRGILQSQKMLIVSNVAGGVGQEFHGLLSTIESQAAALKPKASDAKAIEHVIAIGAAASRGCNLTRQLLAVGGRHSLQTEMLDLNVVLRNANHMLTRLVGEKIALQNSYGAFVTPILADPRLIEHAVVNLVVNARDAIAESGTIIVSTTTVRLDRSPNNPDAPAGEFVRLSVRDNGCGMSSQVQARIFEPFFTTRRSSNAIGLGLATVYGIVNQHSGWIEVTSEEGVGSEFRIFLPCAPAFEVARRREQVKPAAAVIKATVLLVEPDDRARSLARCALNWKGYRVIEADTQSLAQSLWESQSSKIDLLLINLQSGDGTSGFDMANQLQQTKPGLKVVYFAEAEASHVGSGSEDLRIVSKPYTPELLLKQVEKALTV
jgi:PAS domain S-box-containing protein